MSKKNQRQLHVLSQSETTFSTRQQARIIRSEALQMIEAANEFTTNTRRVNRRSAFRVVSRSLHSSEGLPFSVRKHQALTELSNYIALAKHNKVVGLTAFNTDLLPLTHPRSTRAHSMTASAMIRTHVKWVTDDPRITNEDAKALIASAMLAPANSPEKLYAITRLENLPQGHVPLEALTAAYGGGNSAAAKRARVALQLRDRIGRWVEMFGGLGIKVKRRDGSTASLTGRAIGQNIFSPQLADVELGDGRIVAMPIRQARGGNFLASDEAKKDGFTRAGSTADDIDDPIIDEADLTFMESPSSFEKDERGSKQGTTKYTDQAYDVVKFDDNKRALTDLTETNKRRADQDLDDAAVDKQGETDPDSGKQFWDPEKPIYAVSRRGGTPFAYTQNWNDAQQRIQADQRFLDEEEGRTPLARITQDDNTPEDETPLVDQQDKFKKEEIARLSEPEAPAGASPEFKYKVPEDTYEITNPTAPYRSVSEYDDPASLANMFQGDELVEGLDDALDTGLGRLTFPDGTDSDGEPTGGEQEVPAEAILKAIDEKGGDAELALAQAYDKRLGTNENEDALSAQREADKEGKIGEPKKLGEVFDEVTKAPEPEAPAEEETPVAEIPEFTEDAEPSKLPALLDGLTEEEKADFQKNGDYTPYLPKDGPVEWPEGSTPPQDRILSEEERKQALELANSELSDDDLIESYNGAVKNLFDENGSAPFGIEDENNEVQTVQIPSEVLRDAIKLRDYNMDEVNGAVLNGAYDPVEEKDPIKFKKNKETGRMEHDLGDNAVVTYGKDESGNWSADATRYSPDGGVDAEENYPAKNKAEARQIAEDVINSYKETQDIIDPDDLPEQPVTEEEEPVAEIPTPKVPADGKGSKSGKDPIKEGWTVDEWLTSVSKDERFHEMLAKNKDFTRLAAFFNDPTFNSPLLSDYQDKEMEGFESGDEVSAIDMGEYGFEPGPSGRVQYALDLLQDPTMSIRGGFKDWKTGERSNENVRNILKAADDQLGLAKEDLDETDVIENKAIDSVRATLAKEIAKLDKQIEKDNKKAEEDAIAPQVSYKLTGDRLDLRSGKKAPFRVQEVKDFLDDNGFDWNPDAKAETKSGMDEASAKKFLRDLRDKFGIDLLPREGQPPIDLDSKDEVIEAPATPKAPSVKPKEKSLKEREDEEFSKFLPLPETLPEGWEKDEERGYNEVYYQRSVENENGDRISGTYSKDGSREPYWTVSADFESTESFKSFEDALDFYNKNSGKEEITPEAPEVSPEETKPTEEVKEPKVKIKEATFDPENPASQEYAKETLKKLVEDRMLINEEIKNAEANGLTPEEFDALVEMRDEMNEKIDQIVNEVPTDALTSDNDISRAKKEKDEEPKDQDTKEDPTAKKSKRELKKEAKRRKELILKMIFTEFGPGALNLENPDRAKIREFTDILDTLTTAELEQIGDRLNEELGWNFFRSKKPLPKEGDVIIESEGEPSEEPEVEEDIVDADVVPEPEPELTPEEAEEAERQRRLKEIRDRKKREREDKLLEEDEKERKKKDGEEPTPTTPTTPENPATPAEKPAEGQSKKNPAKLVVGEEVNIPDVGWRKVVKVIKVQRGSDKASKKDTISWRVVYEDENGEQGSWETSTAWYDQPDNKLEVRPASDGSEKKGPAYTGETENRNGGGSTYKPSPLPDWIEKPSEEPAVAVTPRISTARTTDLKAGDVMTKDFFTVTNVEQGFEKKRDGEMVPASRVTGYYPGGVEQSSKLWADDVLFDIYRDVTPPAKGDLPELNQPKMGDYGKLTKINGEWELKDPAAQKQFEQDVEKYQEQLSTQKALWKAPDLEAPVKEFTSENTLHVVNGLGKDLKPNDIAFRRDENGELSEFFVIEEVLPGTVMVPRADGKPAEEKVQIRGYYPGHESQVKSWKTGTSVEVLRGEQAANIPAKGDKPAIDSIEPGTLKGQAYKDKNAEISAARKEAGKAYTPDLTASDIPAVLVEKPNSFSRGNRPAFFGKAAELANLKDGKAISDALKGKRVVYFDFETVGTGKFDNDNPDAPIQVAASVWEGGEKVGEINLFINPGEPLGDYYYKTDADGNKVLDPEKLLSFDGQTVDDAFLATQPSIEDQLRAFAEFAGQDAIFVAHNAEFDTNTFEKWAKKFGIDYNMDGVIDTLELAKSMTPKGNKLGQVAKRYGIEKTDEEWHDARTDSEVLPAILEGLLGDMKPDNREFDAATRLAEFEAKRSSYNEKLEAFKKQEAELAMAEAVKRGMSGEQVSVDEMLGKTKTTSGFGSEGSTDSAEEYAYESIFGGKINNTWVEDDENTFVVDEGGATVGDIKIGDFVPALEGGYHEVIDLQQDPEDPNGTIVIRKIVLSGDLYSTRVTDKRSPGVGWSNGKVLSGTLRRRNELAGKTPAEIRDILSKPIEVDAIPVVKDKTPTPKGKKSITPEETQSVVSDAIETITSGAKSDATVEEAVKGLPLDDTVKSVVLADRPDASINHLSADGVALKVGDRVRGTKHGRMGEVRALLTTYGPRGYKNYVKVKFDDAEKRENISAGSLQIINPDDGSGFFTDPTPPATGEPVDPNTSSKSEEELSSLLDGQAPEDTPSVEIPEEPVVTDREARIAQHKLDEEKRMKRALELNYRQVSPDALQALTAAVGDNAEFDKGYKATVTGFMPNLSTGEPLDTSFTFIKPSAKDVMYYDLYEPDDILVRTGPSSLAAIIKSDGKILYFDYPAAPNWKFSVYSLDINNAIENPNAIKTPLGKNPDLQKMGMISLNREIPVEYTGSPDDGPDPDFVADSPDAEPKGIKPTKQQQAVIDAVVAGKDVIVQALAGTGKTSTLKMAARAIAEKDPDKKILYIAFNKAVAAELNADPDRPSNMIARTNTAVAWHHSPTWMQKRSFDKTGIGLPSDVADHLEIGPVKVTEIKKDGTKVEATLSSRDVVAVVRQAVTIFAQGVDEKIMPKHFTDNFVDIPEVLIDYANRWWDDISSPKGKLAMNQSYPEKYVQLNGIDVSMSPNEKGSNPETMIPAADIIFFDEAQDINDVTGDWVRKQKMQKVFVGDGNQSIYGFRGAKDQLDTLEGADKLQITESFRFGPNIAAPANRFLAVAGKSERVIGAGKDQGKVVENLDEMPDPDVVLVRTRGGGFKAMLEYLDQGKTVGISQSTKTDLEEVIETATWLMNGKTGKKPQKYNAELGMYESWEEVGTLVKEGKARSVKAFYDLVNQNGIGNIRDILSRVIVEREEDEASKAARKSYVPIKIDEAVDGSAGDLGSGLKYEVNGDIVVIKGFVTPDLREKLRGVGVVARKTGKQITDKKTGKLKDEWVTDKAVEDDLERTDLLNKIKKAMSGIIDSASADVVVTTAHKSKGLQWDKVRIYDDFWGPRFNKETGEIDMPAPEELRLAYVAITRAQKEVYLGPLTWVNEYTDEKDEQASFSIEAMNNIEVDPISVTPEEFDNEVQETAKNVDPATQKIADAIIAALENGTAPWRKPWTGGGFIPTSVATGKMYEGTNILVLWAAQERNGWTDNRWLTYKQAEKLGGNIKRGEKATSIIHWTPKFKKVEQPDGTTKEVFIYTPPKIINVFNVEQAEGIDLPPLVKGEPIPVSQAEQTLLDTYKGRPEIFYKSQDSAYYTPVTDTIHLPLREQFSAEQDMFETLVHELAHSTGHSSRVNRKDLQDNYGNHKASRGEEELIAEISVALVAARLGVEIDFGNVAAYAQSWLPAVRNDPTMIIKAAKQAQKAVDHMLGKQEEPAKVDEEGNPAEPVGEGVGSEGLTGEEISPTEDSTSKPNSRGYIRSEINPTDLKVGDRLDISGKTRVAAIKIEEDKVLVSTKTIGSRGGGFESFDKNKKIYVWRKEDSVGSEGKTGDEIAEDAGLKPESTPEPNVGEQGKTGEEIAQEDDIKSAGIKGGHDLSPREAFTKAVNRSDRDVKKVYGAEEIYQPQLQRDMERPVAPEREDFPDRESYIAAHKKYSKDFDSYYLERSRNIQSSIGEKHLNGSPKGVQNYVKDIITADWFVEAFGDGGQLGRPPVTLFTGKSYGGKYTYGFKNGAFISSLKINRLLSKSEPNILHEIAHFATAISVAEGHDAHGVEYRMNYIFITNKVLGREAAESLRESYRKANLNVG
jgi:antirestriction protein ArdC/superfamily I DNA/RNA helicase/DNA polymerase III epsilon subunit-like protein